VIAVVVITHNRLHLLRQNVGSVLARTSSRTTEVVVWDNGSHDGTREYLAAWDDPRVRVVTHSENIGQNAYARAFAMTRAPYLVELDDDVVSAPEGWDSVLLDAFRTLPRMGYLAANLADDPYDTAVRYIRYLREERGAYRRAVENGIAILEGPTGGGCTMTSREVYDRVGGFREHPSLVYWREDADYARRVRKHGFRCAILEGLEVVHHGGTHYSPPTPAKVRLHELEHLRRARRDPLKRLLLRLPLVARLNRRLGWFDAPHAYDPTQWGREVAHTDDTEQRRHGPDE
jgi:GT2 family glycosyltransferase